MYTVKILGASKPLFQSSNRVTARNMFVRWKAKLANTGVKLVFVEA